jgi:hypothetical protein
MFRVDSAGIKQGGCNTNGKAYKFNGRVFQHVVGIPMGPKCALLLTDLILYSHKADFHKSWNIVSTERYILHIQVLLECCNI